MPAALQSARIKPTHKAIKSYHDALEAFADQNVNHEMAVRSAFQTLLADCGRMSGIKWTLIPEQSATVSGIVSDPNRSDDREYIVRLVGQVVRVSWETVKILNALPQSYGTGLRDA